MGGDSWLRHVVHFWSLGREPRLFIRPDLPAGAAALVYQVGDLDSQGGNRSEVFSNMVVVGKHWKHFC